MRKGTEHTTHMHLHIHYTCVCIFIWKCTCVYYSSVYPFIFKCIGSHSLQSYLLSQGPWFLKATTPHHPRPPFLFVVSWNRWNPLTEATLTCCSQIMSCLCVKEHLGANRNTCLLGLVLLSNQLERAVVPAQEKERRQEEAAPTLASLLALRLFGLLAHCLENTPS